MMEQQLIKLETEVDELYTFRDRFFENHSLSEADNKPHLVRQQMERLLELAEKLDDSISSAPVSERCRYLLARGRLLNIDEQYRAECEHVLTRATKLQPQHAPAWTELGACVWKRGDSSTARHCFSRAVQLQESAVALRQLSIVERELASAAKCTGDGESKSCQIERSVARARQAVRVDVSDGRSWLVLANALFWSYFHGGGQQQRVLDQCLAAYRSAEKDPVVKYSAELHYNRATCYQFIEEYQAALQSVSLAAELEPAWQEARDKRHSVAAFVAEVDTLVRQCGHLKQRKLMAAIESLSRPKLGPYSCEVAGSPSLRQVLLSELQPGNNTGCLVVGKLVATVNAQHAVSFTFCMIDAARSCVAVNVYNLAASKTFLPGDMIVIAEPLVKLVSVDFEQTKADFRLIRVQSPLSLVVNGRRLLPSCRAPIEFSATYHA